MSEITPFPVDPVIMIKIRPMQERDVPAVAQLHSDAMGKSLWAKLGLPFLRRLYKGLLQDEDFFAYVYEEMGCVKGFIAGSADTQATYGRTLKRNFWELLLHTAWGVIRSPSVLPLLLATPFYFRRSHPEDLPERAAESLFCSFVPELRGKRISGHINKVLFEALHNRGRRYIKITTEADNQAALRQLEHWGFSVRRRFNFYGKEMLTLITNADSNPRIGKY
ncbi:hypothetical protein IJT93_11335 [bacterium]|nr:hypothetical protein [bacterium]